MFLEMLHIRKGAENLTECDSLFKLKLISFGEYAVMWTGPSNLATVSYIAKKRAFQYPKVSGMCRNRNLSSGPPQLPLDLLLVRNSILS